MHPPFSIWDFVRFQQASKSHRPQLPNEDPPLFAAIEPTDKKYPLQKFPSSPKFLKSLKLCIEIKKYLRIRGLYFNFGE